MAFAKLRKKNTGELNLKELKMLKSQMRTEIYRASFRR
jgi:hypothetical protein